MKTENAVEKFIKIENENGRKVRIINPEWVKLQFKNEDCEIINEIKRVSHDRIEYKFNDKIYSVMWSVWNKGVRPHLEVASVKVNSSENDEIPKFCTRGITKSNGKFQRQRCLNPEWVKLQFKNEDCELLNEYVDSKTKLKYKYIGNDERCENKDKIFHLNFNSWANMKMRPHFKDYGKCTSLFNGDY